MSYSKVFGLSALAFGALFALALAASPLFSSADTNGVLTVYVQVLNPQGATFSSGDFSVSVSGQSPSLTNFAGSLQGTVVSLNPGAYSVALTGNTYGFSPSYSVGCQSTMLSGGSQLCVVTLTRYGTNYPVPSYNYGYNYGVPPLYCLPQNQTTAPGQPTTFTAQGGVGGTYNWFANNHTYANMGPSFTTVIEYPGTSAVTVTNASQTATCNVTLQGNGYYYPGSSYPATPAYPLSANPTYTYPYTYPTTYSNPSYNNLPTYTATAYPSLPNAGFEPTNGAQLAFALVLLVGAAVATYPYARKAFAFALR